MYRIIISLIISGCLLGVSGCKEAEPIRIGFLGELTTRAAGLSASGRDGFLLAIEEVNAHGGINGRKVEGLVQDTRAHEATALHAVRSLAERNVSAIVGPMTSQTAVAVLPLVNQAKIPLVSPTVSTNMLNGLDDYFFRVYYTNAQAAALFAGELSAEKGLRRIAAIYDLSNSAYTEDWVNNFQAVAEQKSGSSIIRIPFDLHTDALFLDLAREALEANPEGILILANSIDTAMICQQLAKIGTDIPLYATGWSYSDDLIQFGGKSVEGLNIIQSADLQNPSDEVRHFVNAYQERFRSAPNFPALHAYDATRMILSVLEKTTDPETLRLELLNIEYFKGLQADLSFDRYGDLKHPIIHLGRITDGQVIRDE